MKIITNVVNEKAMMELTAPHFSHPGLEDQALIYEALGLPHHQFSSIARIVNTGHAFLVLEVENETVLKWIMPKQEMIAKFSRRYGLAGFYIFCLPAFAPRIDATTRMFAPTYGIAEDSAAEMAAGPLACYLYRFVEKKTVYKIEQGKFMRPSSPGLIEVNLEIVNNEIKSLYAGRSDINSINMRNARFQNAVSL